MTALRLGIQGFYGITHTGIVSKNWRCVFESIHFMTPGITYFCLSKIFLICAICFIYDHILLNTDYPNQRFSLVYSEKTIFFQDTDCKCHHKSHQSSIKVLKALLQDQELYFHVISRKFLRCWKKNIGL